ncbi:unnamed protein product [Mytilus coruscus]|uniref:G-protein coupled receptors family 1 profile domain-containing protein n=1 Tax=Mytilus coruscus TaxID=42192 RepID=A0A6J8EQX9_MYTCO|nr:unnamed protein product [Mytilus coruscus]
MGQGREKQESGEDGLWKKKLRRGRREVIDNSGKDRVSGRKKERVEGTVKRGWKRRLIRKNEDEKERTSALYRALIINIVAGPTITYLAIIMNLFAFYGLFDKAIKTPSTILMQGLAVADSFTALCIYGFKPMFESYYDNIGRPGSSKNFTIAIGSLEEIGDIHIDITDTQNLLDIKYPLCVMHYCATQFADCFHLVSVLLTASLGLQKMLAVLRPLWSITTITNKKSVIVCCICFVVAIAISVPRMLVVSFESVKNSACYISKPNEILEGYVLTFYPILFNLLLVFAVVTMLVSSCYIIFILCSRKRVRRHSSASMSEKKSCVLIVTVMIVFILSEIPRLVLNTSVITTFASDLGRENIAWNKVKEEIEKESTVCFKRAEFSVLMTILSDLKVSDIEHLNEKVQTVCEKKNDTESIDMDYVDWLIDYVENHVYKYYGMQLKFRIKEKYEDMIKDLFDKLSALTETNYRKAISRIKPTLNCYDNIFEAEIVMITLILSNSECYESLINSLHNNLPFLLLGSSPYSEPMNYVLNIIWGNIDISIENFKLLTEILKISTVFGCASNFLIYILMSQKLRQTFYKKFNVCYCAKTVKAFNTETLVTSLRKK